MGVFATSFWNGFLQFPGTQSSGRCPMDAGLEGCQQQMIRRNDSDVWLVQEKNWFKWVLRCWFLGGRDIEVPFCSESKTWWKLVAVLCNLLERSVLTFERRTTADDQVLADHLWWNCHRSWMLVPWMFQRKMQKKMIQPTIMDVSYLYNYIYTYIHIDIYITELLHMCIYIYVYVSTRLYIHNIYIYIHILVSDEQPPIQYSTPHPSIHTNLYKHASIQTRTAPWHNNLYTKQNKSIKHISPKHPNSKHPT